MLISKEEQKDISQAIEQVEKETDAELVTVLAKQADNYYYILTLWACFIALLLPVAIKFTPLWLSGDELLIMQWATFIVLSLLFRVPSIMIKLVPKSIRTHRASILARDQFLENNLHHTKSAMGVLIFVSEAEHYVEIIADNGISQYVTNEEWQDIVDAFIQKIKSGQTKEGFIMCIENCGKKLKEFAPITSIKNELPNHLVILE
jgi:putative membrane protein